MEDSMRLTDPSEDRHSRHQRHQRTEHRNRDNSSGGGCGNGVRRGNVDNSSRSQGRGGEFGDDECSTDSGCSSGGSTGSAERLSGRGSAERLCRAGRSPRSHCYLDRLRGRPARSQERLSNVQRSSERVRAKSSRSWSPGDARTLGRGGESPSYSPSPSDAHSSSDSDSLKRTSTTDTLRRAFQSFKISSKWENKEKKHAKKSPRRILRSPVSYIYRRGMSGLPQRVPRNAAQLAMPRCCQDPVALYR